MSIKGWMAAALAGLVALVGLEASALACSCLYRPLEEHIADSEGIFKGEVLDISARGVMDEGGLVRGAGQLHPDGAAREPEAR